MSTHHIPGIDAEFTATGTVDWAISADRPHIAVTAAPMTDIFVDPNASNPNPAVLNADTLLMSAPEGDYQLSAKITVGFKSKFDAGVLLVWFNERYWAKFCFEYNPAGQATVVSVVNREVSDDSNGVVVDGNTVWMRISRVDNVTCMHSSLDGQKWDLVRVFDLNYEGELPQIGFEAQSPTGQGCDIEFEEIKFSRTRLADQRDGS